MTSANGELTRISLGSDVTGCAFGVDSLGFSAINKSYE